MARCLVINNETGEVVNVIIAELTDLPPDGCRLELEPEPLPEIVIPSGPTGMSADGN